MREEQRPFPMAAMVSVATAESPGAMLSGNDTVKWLSVEVAWSELSTAVPSFLTRKVQAVSAAIIPKSVWAASTFMMAFLGWAKP